MNVQRDPDAILAAWLEDGPNRLPEQTRRAISFSTRTTEQRRRSPWAQWKTPHTTTFARVAVAAVAVIAVAGGAAFLLGPRSGGGPTPTPLPSVTPAPSSAPPSSSPVAGATVPTDWTSYTSSRFAYTADHPTDWDVTEATNDWPSIGLPEKGGTSMDIFGPRLSSTTIFVTSVPLAAGRDEAALIAMFDSQNAAFCNETSNRHSITLDGAQFRQEDQVCSQTINIIEVLGASDGRFYEINIVRSLSDGSPLTATEREIFDRFLASFRFGGTPASLPAAIPSVPIDWTTYRSSRFAYSIDYPADWTVTPAEVDWPAIDFPDKFGHEHDAFVEFSTAGRLFVSSVPLKPGKTVADWLTELDRWNADHACELSDPRTITVDGVDGREQDGVCMTTDHLIEVVLADDKRLYQINLFGSSGPFNDRDQAIFDRFLASFRFGS
jgi:hypothetical protein